MVEPLYFSLGLLVGIMFGFLLAACAAVGCDEKTVKRGVWLHKDKAYRLTEIEQ